MPANITGPTTNGVSGTYFLQTPGAGATVFDDAAADVLTGSAGQDWFFANVAKDSTDSGVRDKVTDRSASEFANDLDFINGA